MPYYYYDDSDLLAAGVIAAGAVIAAPFLIGKAIFDANAEAKAEEERLEEERKRNAEIARRFGDKKAAIISTAQVELEHMTEDNSVYIQKLKENSATIGTTYATFTFKVPKRVYKISNPALHSSFETIKNMQLNINGDKKFAANLQNDSDYIETLKLKEFDVKEGDVVTIEAETYNDHSEIKDLSLYLFVYKGSQIEENCTPGSVDLNNEIFTFYSKLYRTEKYGTIDFILLNRARETVVKVDLDVIYVLDRKEYTQTVPFDCNVYCDFISGTVFLDELKNADLKGIHPSTVYFENGTTKKMDYRNAGYVIPEKLEEIPYPKEFIKSYEKKIGCYKDLNYFINKEAWGFLCPCCSTPVLRGETTCPKCGIETDILEKAYKGDVDEAYSEWSEEDKKKKEAETMRQEEEARRKKAEEDALNEKKRKKRIILLIIAAIALSAFLIYYTVVIKPQKEKAAAIEKYSNSTYEERVEMYPEMLKYGFEKPVAFFYDDDNNLIYSTALMPGDAVTFPIDFDHGDWDLLGWRLISSTAKDCTLDSNTMTIENRVYTAVLGAEITYLDIDGSVLSTQSFLKSDSSVTLSKGLSSEVFNGVKTSAWKDEKSGIIYSLNKKIENPGGDLTLKAVYSFPVKVLDTDGSTIDSSTVYYEDTYTLPELDESVGYIGWSYSGESDVIHTEKTIKIEKRTDINLRSRYTVTYKNTLTNTENTKEFTLDKGITISNSDLKNVSGYYGVGFEYDGKTYTSGSTLKPEESVTLTSVYKKSVSYGSTLEASSFYVDEKTGVFYTSLSDAEESDDIVKGSISNNWFAITSNGNIYLSDLGKNNAEKIEYLYIPDTVNGRTVECLADDSFSSCKNLKAVRIPDSVVRYGSNVFSNSPDLVIDKLDLTNVTYVGASAFANTTIKEIVTTGTVPYSYYSTDSKHPFYNVKGFETLTIKAGYSTIQNLMSSSMKKTVKSVNIPVSVTKFNDNVFEDCVNLKIQYTLSSRITSIGDSAFKNSGITFVSVDLTGCSSSSSVGKNAFTGTTVKKLIVNNNGVKAYSNYGVSTTSYPFYGVKGFETLVYKEGTTTAYNVLSDSMRSSVTSVTIPVSVTSYANEFLAETKNLKPEFTIPSTIVSIGSSAFKNSGITFTSVDLSGCSSSSSVGANAFTGTTVKKLIVNNNGVKAYSNYGISTTSYPFYGVKGFETLVYKEGTTTAYNVLSDSMRSSVTSVTIPVSVTSYANEFLAETKNLKPELTIPSTIVSIGSSAFKNSGITFTSVDLSGCSSSSSVGANAFTGTTVKKLIVNNNGVKAYSNYGISTTSYPFYNVKGFESLEYKEGTKTAYNILTDSMRKTLKTLKLPASVTTFVDSVFENCNNIVLEKDLEITSAVTRIGTAAFKNSSLSFSSVDLTGCTDYPSVGANAFSGTTVRKLIVNNYGVRTNSNYEPSSDAYPFYDIKDFESLEYKDGTTVARNVLTDSMRGTLTTIKLPKSIITFADSVFENCKKIALKEDLEITSTVTNIGTKAFKNSSLTFSSVNLTKCTDYPSVGANAFSGTTVRKLIVNNYGVRANSNYGVSSDAYPFYNVEGFETLEYQKDITVLVNVLSDSMRETIKSVVLPERITTFNASVFENCKNLKFDFTLSSSVTRIGDSAFKNSGITFISVDLTECTDYPSVGANAFSGTTVRKLIVNNYGVRANSNYGISTTAYPFYNIKGFESLEYKDGTTAVRNVLTDSMRKTLTTIKLPASITTFNESVFENCNKIVLEKELTITSTVTRIYSNAFKNSSLIFSSVDLTGCTDYPSVGANAFSGTTVRKLIVDNYGVRANTNYGPSSELYPFYNVKDFKALEYKAGTTAVKNVLSASMRSSITSVTIPATVISFADKVLSETPNLKEGLTLSSTVTSIGSSAFENSGITFTSVDLTGCTNYPSVGTNAFSGTTVKKLIVNDYGVRANSDYGVSTAAYPLYGVKGFETLKYKTGTVTAKNVLSASMRKTMTEVTVPASVTKIEGSTFADCILLEKISLPYGALYETNTFSNCKAVIVRY